MGEAEAEVEEVEAEVEEEAAGVEEAVVREVPEGAHRPVHDRQFQSAPAQVLAAEHPRDHMETAAEL